MYKLDPFRDDKENIMKKKDIQYEIFIIEYNT